MSLFCLTFVLACCVPLVMVCCEKIKDGRGSNDRYIKDSEYNSSHSSSNEKVKTVPEDPEAKFMTGGETNLS